MVLVPQHQTTPVLRKWSELMSPSSFLIPCNSIYFGFYITLTSEWRDKHLFHVSDCGIEFSQCREANSESGNSECIQVRPEHGYFNRSFQRQTLGAFKWQNSRSHPQVTFLFLVGFFCTCYEFTSCVVTGIQAAIFRSIHQLQGYFHFHLVVPFLSFLYKYNTVGMMLHITQS